MSDFSAPALNALESFSIVNGDAEHEAVRPVVANLASGAKGGIATVVVDLEIDHFIVELLLASVNVEHSWFITFIEDLRLVVYDKTRLSHRGVSHEDDFDRLWTNRLFDGDRWFSSPSQSLQALSHYFRIFSINYKSIG